MLNYTFSTENSTFSTTTWEYPWPPHIHWLDKYLNITSLPSRDLMIDGLILGDKLKYKISNQSNPNFGWIVSWLVNADTLDAYYHEHYANTTESMVFCIPYVSRMHGNRPVHGYSRVRMVTCYNYTPGSMDRTLRQREWEYIWKTNKYTMSAMFSLVAAVFIAGLFGETFKC